MAPLAAPWCSAPRYRLPARLLPRRQLHWQSHGGCMACSQPPLASCRRHCRPSCPHRVAACSASAASLGAQGWLGAKETILYTGKGAVHCARMAGTLLAWATDTGVRCGGQGCREGRHWWLAFGGSKERLLQQLDVCWKHAALCWKHAALHCLPWPAECTTPQPTPGWASWSGPPAPPPTRPRPAACCGAAAASCWSAGGARSRCGPRLRLWMGGVEPPLAERLGTSCCACCSS